MTNKQIALLLVSSTRKLLGALILGGKRKSGGQRKTLRKSYLDLLRKLQLDSNDSALCGC